MMLGTPELGKFIAARFTHHAFRLETLAAYDVGRRKKPPGLPI
jgi:hypothetical protein